MEHRAAMLALEKKHHRGWFAPNYKLLWPTWERLEALLYPAIESKNKAEKIIRLVNGGSIEFWSLEDDDAGRSREYDGVDIDEAGLVVKLANVWESAIKPTLAVSNGEANFFGTPKGLNDYYRLTEKWKTHPSWVVHHAPSSENPVVSREWLDDQRIEMSPRLYRQEVLAEFVGEIEGALWKYNWIDASRVLHAPDLDVVVVAIDPAVSANKNSDETGIVVAGKAGEDYYALADCSGRYSPLEWARTAMIAYETHQADRIVAEKNNGGDMVEQTLRSAGFTGRVELVHASRGKATRAEPVSSLYEQGRVHHVGTFPILEDQLCNWDPSDKKVSSPDRLDALVWAISKFIVPSQEFWVA